VAPSSIGLSFQVEGGYFQILDFLNRVDDLPRVVIVDSLDIGAGEGDTPAQGESGSATGDLAATITARMFTGATPSGGDPAAAGTTAGATTATTAAPTAPSNTGTDQ
jgi:Tfp pilus assembly protein PilO